MKNCFSCEKPLETEVFDKRVGYVYDGLIFRAHGNFGSRIFDPVLDCGESIEIYVCDECIKSKASLGAHVQRKRETHEHETYAKIRIDDDCVVPFDI